MFDKDAVALVTGAGSGIGRATALAFAKAGCRVAVTDVDAAATQRTAAEIGDAAMPLRLEVTDERQVADTFAAVMSRWGRVDHVFNNAGIRGARAEAHELDLADFRRVMEVNVTGVFLCQREALRLMYAAGRGTIVNMASIIGGVVFPGAAQYAASKSAVGGLTRAAAIEAAPRGIRVNAIAPGTIETPLNVKLAGGVQEMRDRYTAGYPVGRLGLPEEIADAVLWLSGSASTFVYGHTLAVDGGYLLR
jgi:NAD(P)-dependent dehydrogenase (short-subunit alcohol dehydrogenase family)